MDVRIHPVDNFHSLIVYASGGILNARKTNNPLAISEVAGLENLRFEPLELASRAIRPQAGGSARSAFRFALCLPKARGWAMLGALRPSDVR